MARDRIIPESVDVFADAAWKIGGVVMAGSLLWLLNGLLSGHTARHNDAHVYEVVATFSKVFEIASVVSAITLAYITFGSRDVVFLIGLIGIVYAAGLPALVQFQIGKRFGIPPATFSEAWMSATFRETGTIVTAIAIVRGAVHLGTSVFDWSHVLLTKATIGLGEKAAQNSLQAKNPNMFTPCWKLPYCRDPIREICPAWHAKKTCWKFGSGCYCDDDMILKIITTDPTVSRRGTAFMHATLSDMATTTKKKGKPPCERCYIFLEHQKLKHSLLSPLVVPASVGVMYFGYPVYKALFGGATNVVTQVWQKISYAPITSSMSQATWFQTTETLFAFVTGFFLLVYLTKALEFAIFKLKV